jgi:carotenoid cleavage dioxygenase-like enzyme
LSDGIEAARPRLAFGDDAMDGFGPNQWFRVVPARGSAASSPNELVAAGGAEGLFAFDALVKHDLDTGNEELVGFDDGVFVSEAVMAPSVGSEAEDDGYLITFTSDVANDMSECLILDAARPADDPVARIRLPEGISSGTRSTWAPLSEL